LNNIDIQVFPGRTGVSEDASMQLLNTDAIIEGPSNQPIGIEVTGSSRGPAEAYSLITSIAVPFAENKMLIR
jgi:hypothetical protein